jgi:hypothetical protein
VYSENLAESPAGIQDGRLGLGECIYCISLEFIMPEIISGCVWGVQ